MGKIFTICLFAHSEFCTSVRLVAILKCLIKKNVCRNNTTLFMGMWCLALEKQGLGWRNQNTALSACFPAGANPGLQGTQGVGLTLGMSLTPVASVSS